MASDCPWVVEHARSLDSEIDWGYPMLEAATCRDSELRLSGVAKITIPVTGVDIAVFVSTEIARWRLRKVRESGWVSDEPLNPPA